MSPSADIGDLATLGSAIRGAWKRYRFARALRSFAREPRRTVQAPEQMMALIEGWGNDWSVQREYIAAMVEVFLKTAGPILECGSGLSTVLLGVLSQARGRHVWTLEHSELWAEKLRPVLARHGIDSVELQVAPLRDYGAFSWYQPELSRFPDHFSMVVCDGPPGSTHGGRYGLLPILGGHLQPGCVILLDDAARAGEQQVLETWARELGIDFVVQGTEKPFATVVTRSTARDHAS